MISLHADRQVILLLSLLSSLTKSFLSTRVPSLSPHVGVTITVKFVFCSMDQLTLPWFAVDLEMSRRILKVSCTRIA